MDTYWLDCPAHGRQAPWALPWSDSRADGWQAIADALRARHADPDWMVWHTNTYLNTSDTPVIIIPRSGNHLLCGLCRIESAPLKPIRIVVRSRRKGAGPPACGGACLNGKRSCDCQCRGRCHGAGSCQCGTPAQRSA